MIRGGAFVTGEVTWNGKPLDVLAGLIEKRKTLLGEMVDDAVMATAINALNSIRAVTRRASETRKPKVTVEATPYWGSWRNTGVGNCIVDGPGKGAHRVHALDGKVVVWSDSRDVAWAKKRVWKVTGEHELPVYYYVGAMEGAAKSYEQFLTRKRIVRRGSLAKNALGVAMNCLSSRPARMVGGAEGRQKASRLGWARVQHGGGFFMVQAGSAIDYGIDALKGGQAAIDIALKKAANRIAAIISRKAALPLAERIPTPFPEVSARVRRQKAS